jgi:hypothetical protein
MYGNPKSILAKRSREQESSKPRSRVNGKTIHTITNRWCRYCSAFLRRYMPDMSMSMSMKRGEFYPENKERSIFQASRSFFERSIERIKACDTKTNSHRGKELDVVFMRSLLKTQKHQNR